MTTANNVYIGTSPGTWAQHIANFFRIWVTYEQLGYGDGAPTFTEWHDMEALLFTYDLGGDYEDKFYFVHMGLVAGAGYQSARLFMENPGWDFEITIPDEDLLAIGGEPLSLYLQAYIEITLRDWIIEYAGATASGVTVGYVDPVEGDIAILSAAYTVTSDFYVGVGRCNVTFWYDLARGDSEESTVIEGFISSRAYDQASAPMVDATTLARIADALEVLSLQDIEVAINHGQAMYSVRGKVTTG